MKVVLITGAASGLGWAIAHKCYLRGDALLLVDMNAQLLAEREAQLNGFDRDKSECRDGGEKSLGEKDNSRVAIRIGDITNAVFRTEMLRCVEEEFSGLDVLINNAGITHRSLVEATHPDVFNKVMAVDWQAPVALAMEALPLLERSKGTIINIGSMAGWMPVIGRAAYCSAKAALSQFFEVLRCEVKSKGIHILNVYPSFLETPIERNALGGDGKPAMHPRSTTGTMRSAEWMAGIILDGEIRRKPWIFPDRLSWFASCLWRLWPRQYLRMMSKRFASELIH